MTTLRHYQSSAIEKLREKIRSGLKRVVLVAATGSGKTRIAAEIIMNATKNGKRVVFVCNRIELVKQSVAAFEKLGIKCGIMQGSNTLEANSQVVVASVQTMARRKFNMFDLAIHDEVHVTAASKAYHKFIESHNNIIHIGLTATPWSKGMSAPKKWLDHEPLWQGLVVAASIPMLIEQGFLVDCDIYAPGEPDLSGVKVVQGDYEKNALGSVMDQSRLVGDIVSHWFKLASGEQTVVFCVNVAHSRHIVAEFVANGVDARHVDGYMTEDERRPIIDAFRNGEFAVLSNCSMLAEGFDVPSTSCCVLARPTKSLIRYIQMCGRSLRIYDNLSEHYQSYRRMQDGIQGSHAVEVGQLSREYGSGSRCVEVRISKEAIFQALESDKRDVLNEEGACISSKHEQGEDEAQGRELLYGSDTRKKLRSSPTGCDCMGGEQRIEATGESQGWEQAEQSCGKPRVGDEPRKHETWTRAWIVSPSKGGEAWIEQANRSSSRGDKTGVEELSSWVIDETGTKIRCVDDYYIGDKSWQILGACFIADIREDTESLANRLSDIHTGNECLLVCNESFDSGRSTRITGVKPAKHRALILDHAGVVRRLGWPTEEMDYELDDGKPKEPKTNERLPKVCPSCSCVYKASLRKCPVCSFEPVAVPKSQETEDGELVQLSKKATKFSMEDKQAIYSALLGWARSKGMKDGAAYHKFKSMVGHYPANTIDKTIGPMLPIVQNWITHENIKWAKSQPNLMKRAA